MTSRLNLGSLIVGAGAIAVAGAVVAGLLVVGSPGDARALRLDQARLQAISRIAVAARCVWTATDRLPGSVDQLRQALDRGDQEQCLPNRIRSDQAYADITLSADGDHHIRLCSTFLRPTPSDQVQQVYVVGRTSFPELAAQRPAAGPYCYRLNLQVNEQNAEPGDFTVISP